MRTIVATLIIHLVKVELKFIYAMKLEQTLRSQLGFKYFWIYAWIGHLQPPIWCTLVCKTIEIWWLVNMEYKYLKLWLLLLLSLIDVFARQVTFLNILLKVVCPNIILKCQFWHSINTLEHALIFLKCMVSEHSFMYLVLLRTNFNPLPDHRWGQDCMWWHIAILVLVLAP